MSIEAEVQKEADNRYPELLLAPENERLAEAFEQGALWAVSRVSVEQIADVLAGYQIGSGYYATAIGIGDAQELAADIHALLTGEEA